MVSGEEAQDLASLGIILSQGVIGWKAQLVHIEIGMCWWEWAIRFDEFSASDEPYRWFYDEIVVWFARISTIRESSF